MEKQPKIEIAKSVGKIGLVLVVCFLFLQMGKISVTNAIMRDQASAKNNSFVAGTWGDSLGLRSADAVIEEAIELGILGEESLKQKKLKVDDVVPVENTDPALEDVAPALENPEDGTVPEEDAFDLVVLPEEGLENIDAPVVPETSVAPEASIPPEEE